MTSKTTIKNVKYLSKIAKDAKEETKAYADQVVELYEKRKIKNITTAENYLLKFASTNKNTRKAGINNFIKKEADIKRYGLITKKSVDKKKETENQAIQKIQAKYQNYRFRTTRIIDSVEVKKADTITPTNLINLRLKAIHNNMPDPEDRKEITLTGDRMIDTSPNNVNKDAVFSNIKHRLESVTESLITKLVNQLNQTKINITLTMKMFKINPVKNKVTKLKEQKYTQMTFYLATKVLQFNKSNIKEKTSMLLKDIEEQHDLIKASSSEWIVKQFISLEIKSHKIKPERGATYITTPEKYKNPKCGLVNIKNDDNKCFFWCCEYHKTKQGKNDERPSQLKQNPSGYDYTGVEFPASFEDIRKFEQNNNESVFVYGIDDKNNIHKLMNGNHENLLANNCQRINLLYVEDDEKSHYIYIKKIDRLLNSSYYTSVASLNVINCPYCNKFKFNQDADPTEIQSHVTKCYNVAKEGSLLTMPEEGAKVEFKNYRNKLQRPYIIYADFESTLEKTGMKDKVKMHIANSCCYYFVCTHDHSKNILKTFKGDKCAEDMLNDIQKLADQCVKEMEHNEQMKITPEQEKAFKCASCCHICNKPFNYRMSFNAKANNDGESFKLKPKLKCDKVRDHDHITGLYRGPAHKSCNFNYFCNKYVPVVIHNLRGYDTHLILKSLKSHNIDKLSVIPNSYEKFMSFSIGNLKFIDSFQFMSSSLEKLVDNLTDEGKTYDKLTFMKKELSEHFELLARKGVYPYEWFDNNNKFNHIGLPPKEDFYSSIKLEHVSETDYNYACEVYDKLNCKTFEDYHMTYLKCDVLQLADVFENFRKISLEYYELDPANYITAPSLAWDAMLLKTGIKLDLISDIKILEIIERHKRGGLTFVGSKRYVKANNHYMTDFDPNKTEDYIMYWDANNLYGWAMSEYLPYKNIKFDNNVKLDTILKTKDKSKVGYILEVDLHFPKNLHNKLKEYPPCPESLAPSLDWLSKFQQDLAKENKLINSQGNLKESKKLIPHLMDHKNYVIHYRNLKYIKSLGIEITKVHNVISFNQKPWMEPYIRFNNDKRKQAKDDFAKDFFKLMNNAVFGKTMENVKNRSKMHITIKDDNAVKWFTKPTFKSSKDIEGVYLIEMLHDEIVMDKPIYVGTSILDLSKLHMMKFHYDVIHEQFEGKYNLIYSDTDSLVYRIEHNDIYKWTQENKEHFDLNGSSLDWLKDPENDKKLGCFKDENNSYIMKEFLALNPKVYSYVHDEFDKKAKEVKIDNNTKKLKGVSKAVVKKEIQHEDFYNCFRNNEKLEKHVTSIRSFNHQLYTLVQPKVALTSYYDKMYMLDDGITCYPFGFQPN